MDGVSSADAASALCALGSFSPTSDEAAGARKQGRLSPSESSAAAGSSSSAFTAIVGSAFAAANPSTAGLGLGTLVPGGGSSGGGAGSRCLVLPGVLGPEPKRRRLDRQPKQGWTQQEDATILSMVHEMGTKWSAIAARLRGRTDDAVRNRYIRLEKKKTPESGPAGLGELAASKRGDMWTASEDESILQGVSTHGFKWQTIGASLPGRSVNAVRNRYLRLASQQPNATTTNTATPLSPGQLYAARGLHPDALATARQQRGVASGAAFSASLAGCCGGGRGQGSSSAPFGGSLLGGNRPVFLATGGVTRPTALLPPELRGSGSGSEAPSARAMHVSVASALAAGTAAAAAAMGVAAAAAGKPRTPQPQPQRIGDAGFGATSPSPASVTGGSGSWSGDESPSETLARALGSTPAEGDSGDVSPFLGFDGSGLLVGSFLFASVCEPGGAEAAAAARNTAGGALSSGRRTISSGGLLR